MQQQTHCAPKSLHVPNMPDTDVQVLFAAQPSRKAILFIHGFSGDALDTWSDFQLLLPECNKCVGRDLFFYGYDGLRADMNASAALFRKFLERLFQDTPGFLNKSLSAAAQRPAGFGFDEFIIVAHSLGAVITRRALLDATRLKLPWVQNIKLVLYAPAHSGARVVKLALEVAKGIPFLKHFAVGVRFVSPLIDQLDPKGSTELKRLLDETVKAVQGGANPHLVARKVVIAEYERIISDPAFADDPPPDAIPKTNHITVCKPRRDFLSPLEHLEECL